MKVAHLSPQLLDLFFTYHVVGHAHLVDDVRREVEVCRRTFCGVLRRRANKDPGGDYATLQAAARTLLERAAKAYQALAQDAEDQRRPEDPASQTLMAWNDRNTRGQTLHLKSYYGTYEDFNHGVDRLRVAKMLALKGAACGWFRRQVYLLRALWALEEAELYIVSALALGSHLLDKNLPRG